MMNNVKTIKLLLLVGAFGILVLYLFIHFGNKSNVYSFGQLHLSKNGINPEKLSSLLSEKEKAALIKEIVQQSLKEIISKRKITHSTQTVIQTTSISKTEHSKTVSPHVFQKAFHFNPNAMNSDLVKRNSKLKPFQIQTSNEERAIMYKLLEVFDKTLTKNKIPYFMYGGTLLGSFRHHDLIPWDDDIDVIVSLEYHDKMLKIFKAFEPEYVLYRAGGHDKLFHKSGKKVPSFNWKWPYVDISYYEVNGSYIKDWTMTYGYWYYYPKEIVFPLHRRPLLNLSLPAPRDTFTFLTWTYNYGSLCRMYGYSHMVEGGGPAGNVNCESLQDKFPFVHHLPHKNGVREMLKFKDLVINDLVIDEPKYAVAETFKLSLKSGYSLPKHLTPPPS